MNGFAQVQERIASIEARFEPPRAPAVSDADSAEFEGLLEDYSATGSVATQALFGGPRTHQVGSAPAMTESLRAAFEETADRYGLDVNLLMAVSWQESAFNPSAVSHAGAMGLMQLMPRTAVEVLQRVRWVDAQPGSGARYLREQIDRFGSVELALAAYNAGPGAVQRHGGIPPFEETQNYVPMVLQRWRSLSTGERIIPFAPQPPPVPEVAAPIEPSAGVVVDHSAAETPAPNSGAALIPNATPTAVADGTTPTAEAVMDPAVEQGSPAAEAVAPLVEDGPLAGVTIGDAIRSAALPDEPELTTNVETTLPVDDAPELPDLAPTDVDVEAGMDPADGADPASTIDADGAETPIRTTTTVDAGVDTVADDADIDLASPGAGAGTGVDIDLTGGDGGAGSNTAASNTTANDSLGSASLSSVVSGTVFEPLTSTPQTERVSVSRIPQQIANMATGTGGEVRLELSPEGLGDISLRVSLTAGGDVAIEILADSESTVAILGRLQETLESTLRAQGVELDSFDVSHDGEPGADAESGGTNETNDRSSDQPQFDIDGDVDDTGTGNDNTSESTTTPGHGGNVLRI